MSQLKDPANFLVESGLLFEINRRILHPLGLAIAVEAPDGPDTSTVLVANVWDSREDPEGFTYDDADLASGRQKIMEYLAANHVRERLMARRAILGYITQPAPPESEPPFSIGPRPDQKP